MSRRPRRDRRIVSRLERTEEVGKMALSAFDDKSKKPTATDLEKMLGRANAHWKHVIAHISSSYPPVVEVWNFSGEKWGWSLRLKRKERVLVYMTPCKGHFLAGFVLGGKAVKAAHDRPLSDSVLAVIDGAKKYAEGTGFRIEVRTQKDRDAVMELAAIKVKN